MSKTPERFKVEGERHALLLLMLLLERLGGEAVISRHDLAEYDEGGLAIVREDAIYRDEITYRLIPVELLEEERLR